MSMNKKHFCLITVILLLGIVGSALADTNWTNGGDDRQWDNASNWSAGVPTTADKAGIRASIAGPIIDSGTTAVANLIVCGDWGHTDVMDITGGTLTTGGWFILAYGAGDVGTFNVSGGTTSVGSHLDVGFGGAGHMNMTGGLITVSGAFGIATNGGSGDVQLDGGTISCSSFSMATGATMDITAGTLIVDGDVRSTINTYISNGWLTAYDGTGTLNVDYNTPNPGKTTVTAESPDVTVPDVVGQTQLDAESNIEVEGLSVGSITDELGPSVSSCFGNFNGVEIGDGVDLPVISGSPINEASGLAQSRSGDDLFWVNNDSGDSNRIHAVNKSGEYLGQVVLSGASAVDYEDIATGPGPNPAKDYIYIGDVGDNGSSRTNCRIYRIEEPDISGLSTPFNISANVSVFPISYPEHPWNCETLMVDPDTLDFYLVTKEGGDPPNLYRGTTDSPGTPQTLTKMGDLTYFAQLATDVDPGNDYYGIPLFEPDGMIAGDISRSGREIIIRTHRRAFYWHRQIGESIADAMLLRDPTIFRGVWQEGAGECLCIGTDDSGFYSLAEGSNPHMRFYERGCSGNYVVSQDPTGGTIVPYASSVDLVVSTSSVPTDRDWTNGDGNRAWDNPANWSGGAVPRSIDKACIRNDAISGPVIDSGTAAVAANMVVGDWASTADTVDMTGGSLTVGGWLILGYWATNNGTFTISAGTADIGGNMIVGRDGAGTVDITGGSVSVGSMFGIAQNAGSTGDVFLDGGTISSDSINMTSGGLLDITEGTLIVNGDVTSTINGYISSGWITAYDGAGTVDVDYDISNPGKTTVTASTGSYCGDGTCDPDEDQCNCSDDCGTPPSTETSCTDSVDNDCDTYTDCDDVDCDTNPACPGCGNTVCEPGIGEDQCNCPADCGTPPSTETSCTDSVDNDCDTYTDCDDSDCDTDPACQGGDTVTITKAEYKVSRSEINVEATSSDGGSVTLTVVGYGDMTYDSRKDIFKYKVRPVADPGGTVTVTSSGGGQDTANVTYK